jgi:uncharacterized membrane protein
MDSTHIPSSPSLRQTGSKVRSSLYWIARHWVIGFATLMGLYVGVPFLAPIFMHTGWTGLAKAIYAFYSTQCHQLPDRSFFFYGPNGMYSLSVIQAHFKVTLDPAVLRQFIGDPSLGWKVAWSDRMVSMYTSTLLFGLLWWTLRKSVRPLPFWAFVLFLLPMALDGTSHMVSDFMFNIGSGFRYDNTWLAALTSNALPTWFYNGNALGSFNSWMRLITGVLFGFGVVWFGFPYLNDAFNQIANQASNYPPKNTGQNDPSVDGIYPAREKSI